MRDSTHRRRIFLPSEYIKLPTRGQIAENIRPDLKVALVYQTEYRKAANIAENEDTPMRVAPKAPLVPKSLA